MTRLEAVENCIRQGRLADARRLLQGVLDRSAAPETEAARLARLLWRADNPLQGIRLLQRRVRPGRQGPARATPEERAEYAQCLTRLGAHQEAEEWLNSVDPKEYPRALFYRAAIRIARWEYREAVPLLESYIALDGSAVYDRLVALVNLAACLVHERETTKASWLLNRLAHESSLRRFPFLSAYCYQLGAENALTARDFRLAGRILGRAARMLRGSSSREEVYVTKWRLVMRLLKEGPCPRLLEEWGHLRAEAERRRLWETIRDCDQYLALATRDVSRFHHVYFGTPFESFRRRLAGDFGAAGTLPESYLRVAPSPEPVRCVLDTYHGLVEGGPRLKSAGTLHLLIHALAADFYRPLRVASLFRAIFPGEYFNPDTSPDRVHQAIKLLKKWLRREGLPFAVEEAEGFYRLEPLPGGALRTYAGTGAPERLPVALSLLRRQVGTDFTSAEAARVLQTSARSAVRLLDEGIRCGALVRVGSGTRIRYQAVS